MSEKIKLTIAASLAAYLRPETPASVKLQIIGEGLPASHLDWATLLFFLSFDKDPGVRSAAQDAFKALAEDVVADVAGSASPHPRFITLLYRFHGHKPGIARLIAARPDLPEELAGRLSQELAATAATQPLAGAMGGAEEQEDGSPVEEEYEQEETEEFFSKYQLAQTMGIAEKIKMALTGDKEWRSILLKDANKLVNGSVIKNPRISEPEVLAICKASIQNEEIVRVICQNKEWLKNYQIRKALVVNPKTPLPVALKFMGTLTEKDLAVLAKSKNVSTVLVNNARRSLLNKKKA